MSTKDIVVWGTEGEVSNPFWPYLEARKVNTAIRIESVFRELEEEEDKELDEQD